MVNDYCGLGDPKKAAQKNLEHNNVPWFYVSENGKTLIRSLVYKVSAEATNSNSKAKMENCALFSTDELRAISEAVSIMEKLFLTSVRVIAVEDAYNEFRNELQNLNSSSGCKALTE